MPNHYDTDHANSLREMRRPWSEERRGPSAEKRTRFTLTLEWFAIVVRLATQTDKGALSLLNNLGWID